MEKFVFEGEEYNIISENKGSTERGYYQMKMTDQTRERELYAWRPWWIGKKFRWFKKIKIRERLWFDRSTTFDDGWSYQNYWQPWRKIWEAEEILS
jgi:hypothetical protein